jgi:hypothetical protein
MKSPIILLCALLTVPAYALDPLQCADGTRLTGDEPPKGTQQQCVLPDGTLHGEQRVWYHDGKLMEQRHFDHGKEHGEQQGWWPNGQLMMQGVSVQGKRYSGYKYWDVAGNPTKIETATVPETSLPDIEQKPAGETPPQSPGDDAASKPADNPQPEAPQQQDKQPQDEPSKDAESQDKALKDKEAESEKAEDEENEPLQDAIDQSQLKDVAPLPPASIP